MTSPLAPSAVTARASGHPLDNIAWHALSTTHRHVAIDGGRAARYRPDVAPFFGTDVLDDAGWRALADLAGDGGFVVLFRDEVTAPPAGWDVPWRSQCHQMVADAGLAFDPAHVPGLRALGDDDVPAMLDLVALTQPGPFTTRTIELGGYLGVFDGERLVAMAGERMSCPGYVEVSAVCTHPDARGRGLAAGLTIAVAAAVRARGEVPFLHVEVTNHGARRVYERIGLRHRRLVDVVLLRAPRGER